MSLTNEQITAQNFKDFYNGIRPYLNGQVPTFANAFNKSDLYSTDEKIVGCWIDGKPLYQKTFLAGALPNGTNSNYVTDLTVANCHPVEFWGSSYDPTDNVMIMLGDIISRTSIGNNLGVYLTKSSSYISFDFRAGNDFSMYTDTYITLRYTKTTDTAIKVGDGNDYSTDEQIIGAWVDGKPVYQLTVEGESFSTGTNWTNYPTPSGLNVDTIISAILYRDDGDIIVNPIQFGFANGTFRGYASENLSSMSGYTVRYTKTTD